MGNGIFLSYWMGDRERLMDILVTRYTHTVGHVYYGTESVTFSGTCRNPEYVEEATGDDASMVAGKDSCRMYS